MVIVIIGNEYGFIRIQKEKRKIKRRAHSESFPNKVLDTRINIQNN